MNKRRLATVRDEVAKLNAAPPRSETTQIEHQTCDTRLTDYAENVPAIDTLDMETYHAEVYDIEQCRTVGCIAGLTVCLHPEQTQEIMREWDEERETRPGIGEIAQQILELDREQTHALFYSRDQATPEEAANAIDRLLAGADADNIWNPDTEATR